MNKKEREWLQQQQADREEARANSEHRQQRIEVLWKVLTSGSLAPKDKESAPGEPLRSLVELAELQRREIEYLREFWWICASHGEPSLGYPIDARPRLQLLATLIKTDKSQPLISKAASPYEYKRRGYAKDGVGQIERQFGLGYFRLSALSPSGPNCLDEIFKSAAVNMWRLQQLFGIHRNRFPIKKLPTFEMGREMRYDYRAVVVIMKSLLSDNSPKRNASARGRPGRKWLSDFALRARVLSGIEARLKIVSAPERIQAAFLDVVRGYLPNSAKK